jgi:hypothetical protein
MKNICIKMLVSNFNNKIKIQCRNEMITFLGIYTRNFIITSCSSVNVLVI